MNEALTTVMLVCIFLGWLHICCGLSHNNCQKARNFILRILSLCHDEDKLDRYNDRTPDNPQDLVPKDVRTIIKNLSITPELEERVCCPMCFT
ncbi:hypothetical protein CROQUDRAFT_656353 [Cronartium quercuum f. sp. fusiforme G11]|uniref:Uncharacterized protein n=1 Tax=Cronartium quercuum f. sp. fusiforme G11 TaxID=708437 RepID=A0A9P6TCD5_9BASI|nr:hypothetical protein CROQUDRAFT_656353 [Cronartium quercuum f. sp. fusiforme G11]